MSPSLEESAAGLYAVEPGRFTAERTRLTGEARQAKDAETAKAIAELRRPTTSAWLINQLVRGEQGADDEIGRLDQLGQELREAQAALDAALMRELTKERHQLVASLARRADAVAAEAGQKMSAAVRREVEDTLGAAVADERASLAVLSGRLTRALTYAGFGEVDVADATATPLSAVLPFKARRSDRADQGGPESDDTGAPSGRRAMKRSDSKLTPVEGTQADTHKPGAGGKEEEESALGAGRATAAHQTATDEANATGKASSTGKGRRTGKKAEGRATPAGGTTPDRAGPEDGSGASGGAASTSKAGSADQPDPDDGASTSGTTKQRRSSQKSAEETRVEKLAARRAAAAEHVAAARAELDAAEEALHQKEQELEEATTEQTGLQARLHELQAEVVTVRRKLDAGDRRVSHAERDVTRQERQLKDVTKSVDRAEAALDRIDQAQGS